MDWIVGDEDFDMKDMGFGEGPVTKMDSAAENIHSGMRKVRDFQVNNLFSNSRFCIK